VGPAEDEERNGVVGEQWFNSGVQGVSGWAGRGWRDRDVDFDEHLGMVQDQMGPVKSFGWSTGPNRSTIRGLV
jgi:hypothetical protein